MLLLELLQEHLAGVWVAISCVLQHSEVAREEGTSIYVGHVLGAVFIFYIGLRLLDQELLFTKVTCVLMRSLIGRLSYTVSLIIDQICLREIC